MKIKNFPRIIILSAILVLSISSNLFSQDIVSCVINGRIEDVKALLAHGISPNTKPGSESILAMSRTSVFPEMTKLLINAKGIRLNDWNIQRMPELSWKYQVLMKNIEFPEIVKLLIDKGAMLDLQDDQIMWDGKLHESGGCTALMFAIGQPNFTYTESAKLLIAKGANINIQNKMGYTALMGGVHNTEISKILIDKGAKLNIQSKGGETALMLAAGKYTEVVKMLIDKGANILIRQSTFKVSPNALDYAAMTGNIEAGKLLLARAVTLGVKPEMFFSSMHWAVTCNQLEMTKYLLDEGANIEGNDDLGGYTPLMETSMLEMVEMLISRGANVKARNKFDYTPLHKAISNYMVADPNEKNCDKIVNILLDNGADIDAQDGNGNTPLIYSVQKINPLKNLIARGANVNTQNKNGESVLMFAVKGGLLKVILGGIPIVGGSVEAVKYLVSKGADIEAKDKWGKTALMHAAGGVNAQGNKYGTYTDIAEFLIKKGAKLDVEDNEGHTALYWANRYNRTKTADLLLAKGANPAKNYNKADDKSNVEMGLVGSWEKSFSHEGITYTTRVEINADWSYSKKLKPSNGPWVTDGPGYNAYELRDGRMWIFINKSFPAVIEYRFEGKTLIMNGEKYVKVGLKK